MRRESGCENGCQLGRQAGHAWGLGPQAHRGGLLGGATPDASSKLITRVIYTDKFQLQTQFLLMQACPSFHEGMCMNWANMWLCWGLSGGRCVCLSIGSGPSRVKF